MRGVVYRGSDPMRKVTVFHGNRSTNFDPEDVETASQILNDQQLLLELGRGIDRNSIREDGEYVEMRVKRSVLEALDARTREEIVQEVTTRLRRKNPLEVMKEQISSSLRQKLQRFVNRPMVAGRHLEMEVVIEEFLNDALGKCGLPRNSLAITRSFDMSTRVMNFSVDPVEGVLNHVPQHLRAKLQEEIAEALGSLRDPP